MERGKGSSSSSSSSGDEGDEPKKLTRAQRKRLRKKKLKEAASTHRKFIGPTLPGEANGDVAGEGPPCVRQNASNKPGES